MAGRAYPIEAVPSSEVRENPYEAEIAAVDAVPAGSVVVATTGDSYDAALWGELLTTRTLARGAVGAVVDGAVRDLVALERLQFPTFAAAVSAKDSAGRLAVVGYGEPVACGGVTVNPGDLVLADCDGVVVIPATAAAEALARAEEKREREQAARGQLEAGASVAEVYERYRIL